MAVPVLVAVAALLAVGVIVVSLRWRAAIASAHETAQHLTEVARAERQKLEQELGVVRDLLERMQRSWRAEREWSRELRSQISRQHHGRDGLDDDGPTEVRELVLKAAIELTEGERGLLLSREDADNDGDLDVVISQGFTHDPRHSAVAQRFAREVLERDQIVREDAPTAGDAAATAADREIDSLVAIPMYLRDRFHGVVVCVNRPGGFEEVGDDVLLALGDHAGAALQHGHLRRELQDARRSGIRSLLEAVAAGDPMMYSESGALVIHALRLARDLEMSKLDRDVLLCAVLLRGVGHLALPERVLLKPGPLTREERLLVEVHPRAAFNVIGQDPGLRDVATAVLYHQERYDGTGYPAGLSRDAIPRAARALAVLEAFSAMTHGRPYREPLSVEDACRELVDGAGSQFDPEIAQLFVEEVRGLPEPPSDELVESVLEVLPFDPSGATTDLLGPLGGPSTDGLTLLGDHRALQESVRYAVEHADDHGSFAIAVVQLEDLARINAQASFLVGDRVIQTAARNLKRAAVRLGATAYRASGRRLAVLAPLRDGTSPERVHDEIEAEFVGGPSVRIAVERWRPGERGEELVARARQSLQLAA
jgi:HD-GYP domain-containing protein (c-di-GMP phosphodiesterase class II)/GGDEF domain-containing protein